MGDSAAGGTGDEGGGDEESTPFSPPPPPPPLSSPRGPSRGLGTSGKELSSASASLGQFTPLVVVVATAVEVEGRKEGREGGREGERVRGRGEQKMKEELERKKSERGEKRTYKSSSSCPVEKQGSRLLSLLLLLARRAQ